MTGWGRIWKLGYFSNVLMPGRWIHRIDEEITPGGCSNGSTGFMVVSPPLASMQVGPLPPLLSSTLTSVEPGLDD